MALDYSNYASFHTDAELGKGKTHVDHHGVAPLKEGLYGDGQGESLFGSSGLMAKMWKGEVERIEKEAKINENLRKLGIEPLIIKRWPY